MKKKTIVIICAIILFIGGVVAILLFNQKPKVGQFNFVEYSNYIIDFPSNIVLGPVNNAESAKDKAQSVWLQLYGESIKDEKPYQVFFDESNEMWLVTGSMPKCLFDTTKGGVANIIIRKSDGKVLAVWHDK
ncbi:MAG: hypothetical protein KIC77_11005 [Clostridiales bacterium]|jgi:hypothetical protein|nr:hypothetical protein [Clostridiales bacterium]